MRNEPRIDILELAYINSPIKCLNEIIKLNSNLDVRINRNEREIKSFNELNGIKSRWHTYVMLCFNEKLEKQNLSNWNYPTDRLHMNIIGVIPARSGSKGVLKKI